MILKTAGTYTTPWFDEQLQVTVVDEIWVEWQSRVLLGAISYPAVGDYGPITSPSRYQDSWGDFAL